MCYIGIASHWEMEIKHSIGKLDLKTDLKKIFKIIDMSGLQILPITSAHILMNTTLKFHHRDPFDRLIIAQAVSEELTVKSKDEEFKQYDINLIWKKTFH